MNQKYFDIGIKTKLKVKIRKKIRDVPNDLHKSKFSVL